MILITEPYIHFGRNLDPSRFPEISERLLGESERIGNSIYGDLRTRVFVRVEQGSTKVWVSITAAIGALTFYGDVRQSIDYLAKDSRMISTAVLPMVRREMGWTQSAVRVSQSRSGVPGKLRRLFQDVAAGKITPDEGTREAVELLYRVEGPAFEANSPNLAERIASEMYETGLAASSNRRRRKGKREQRQDRPESIPLLPSPRIGVIVSRDPLSGAVKISNY